MDYLRIWADADGETHLEDVTVPSTFFPSEHGVAPLTVSAAVPVRGVEFVTIHADDQQPTWHSAPRDQFVVFLGAGVRIETSDGAVRELPRGSVVRASDVASKGHVTTHLGPGELRALVIPADAEPR